MTTAVSLSAIEPQIVEAGVSGLAAMLMIAGIALVLGLAALWLARRHSHRERAADATTGAATGTTTAGTEHRSDTEPPRPGDPPRT